MVKVGNERIQEARAVVPERLDGCAMGGDKAAVFGASGVYVVKAGTDGRRIILCQDRLPVTAFAARFSTIFYGAQLLSPCQKERPLGQNLAALGDKNARRRGA